MSTLEKEAMASGIIFIAMIIYLIYSREIIYKKIGRDKRTIVKCAVSVLIIAGIIFGILQSQSIIYTPLKQKNIEELKKIDGIIGFKEVGRGNLILQIKHNGQYFDATIPLASTPEDISKYANKHAEVWYEKSSQNKIAVTYQLNVDKVLYSLERTNSNVADYNTSIYFKNLMVVEIIILIFFYTFTN